MAPPVVMKAQGGKGVPHFFVVVDFAVVDSNEAAGRGKHRLIAGRRKIDHGEAIVRECDLRFRIAPHARMVRPAMVERSYHAAKRCRDLALARPFAADESRNSAHERQAFFRPTATQYGGSSLN